LGDRFDRKWLLIIGLLCQITTNLAGSTATTFSGLLVSRFFLGVSECVFNVIAVPFVSDLFPPKTRTYAIQVTFNSCGESDQLIVHLDFAKFG
jgi:predicted MFS family arabinose efflux permease